MNRGIGGILFRVLRLEGLRVNVFWTPQEPASHRGLSRDPLGKAHRWPLACHAQDRYLGWYIYDTYSYIGIHTYIIHIWYNIGIHIYIYIRMVHLWSYLDTWRPYSTVGEFIEFEERAATRSLNCFVVQLPFGQCPTNQNYTIECRKEIGRLQNLFEAIIFE